MVKHILIFSLLLSRLPFFAQGIANYVNNGGFEKCRRCSATPFVIRAKYWDGIDTNKYSYQLLSRILAPFLVPNSSYTSQNTRHGNNYIISTVFYQPYTPYSSRGYPRNTLKQQLSPGETYCVKFYYNITDKSSYGINSLGAYFGDNSTDTITQCSIPITFLSPQISNPSNTMLTDTANWQSISGIFTATGNEKYLILGNFSSDSTTDTLMINPYILPLIATDVLYEDVSCIPINLPAYAGPDQSFIPGDSLYIGRESDVEIDESCIWYQMTSPTTSITIDTIAGIWVKPVTTTTYVVRQQLWCSGVKWDTVVVYIDAVGIKGVEDYQLYIRLFPIPASDFIQIEYTIDLLNPFTEVLVYNQLGQLIFLDNISFKNRKADISTSNLDVGVYSIELRSISGQTVRKRFVVSR